MTAKDYILNNCGSSNMVTPQILFTLYEVLELMEDFAENKINEYLNTIYFEERECNEMDFISEEELKTINRELEDEINSNF